MAKFVSVILAIVVIFAASAMAGPADCKPYNVNGIRCAKSNAGRDTVRIDSKTGERITYRVGFWLSICGWPGSEYRNMSLESLKGNKAIEFDIEQADGRECREAFIYDCKVNGNTPINCNEALIAYRI